MIQANKVAAVSRAIEADQSFVARTPTVPIVEKAANTYDKYIAVSSAKFILGGSMSSPEQMNDARNTMAQKNAPMRKPKDSSKLP